VANLLEEKGITKGDKVAIMSENSPELLHVFYGLNNTGAIWVLINNRLVGESLRYVINVSDTTYLIVSARFREQIGQVVKKVDRPIQIFSLEDLDKEAKGKSPVYKSPAKPDDICYLLHTSGTTGFPKGVPCTHSGMVAAVNDYRQATEGYYREGDDVLIMVNPLFHILAEEAILGWGLTRGITTVLMPMPQVDAILEAIQRYKVTIFLGVPALYRMILENDRLDLYDLSSLRYCWSGGDVLPLEVYNRWKQKFHVPVYQDYGSTESSTATLSPLDKEPVPGSVGFPLPSKQFKIVDPDTLEPVPLNTVGELLATSEYRIKSYWNKPEETAASYVELDGKTWYRTKDHVRMDEDGLLYYVDRSADIIKYKGYRVSCSEIEAALQNHSAVIGACVVGVPDDRVGERIKAMVVLKEDARGVGSSELVRWCRDRLAPYKIPQYIEFRDMLPKSKVGKLLRREIRDEERRRITKEEE